MTATTAMDPGLTRTDWGMIQTASGPDVASAAKAMQSLARRYWPAMYAFIRRSGFDVHAAADLTQGFICDVVLGRRLVQRADPARGRFRSLLLTALQNYLRDRQRRVKGTRRRSGPMPVEIDLRRADETVSDYRVNDTPQRAFASQWSATLVRQVLESVREQCLTEGLEPHWIIFEHRVARPMLLGDAPADYPTLLRRLGLRSPARAANMLITVKRRVARALLDEVRRTVDDPNRIEEELHDLLRSLERAS